MKDVVEELEKRGITAREYAEERKVNLMTMDQVMGLARQLLPFLGGVAVALGFLTSDQVKALYDSIGLALPAIGTLVTAGGVVWSVIANSKKSILASANNMPEVKAVVMNDKSETGKAAIADKDLPKVVAKVSDLGN